MLADDEVDEVDVTLLLTLLSELETLDVMDEMDDEVVALLALTVMLDEELIDTLEFSALLFTPVMLGVLVAVPPLHALRKVVIDVIKKSNSVLNFITIDLAYSMS